MAGNTSFNARMRAQMTIHKKELTIAASWIGFAVVLILLRSPADVTDLPLYEAGQVADKTVIAPFTFSVTKAKNELEREQQEAASRVQAVYRPVGSAYQRASYKLETLRGSMETWEALQDSIRDPEAMLTPGFTLSSATRNQLSADSTRNEVFEAVETVLPLILSRYIVEDLAAFEDSDELIILHDDSTEVLMPGDSVKTVEQFRDDLSRLLLERFEAQEILARAVYEITAPLVSVTLTLDQQETDARRRKAMESISSIKGTLLAGETIVEAHYRVTEGDVDELRSLQEVYADRARSGHDVGSILPIFGHVLWIAVYLGLVAGIVAFIAPERLRSPSDTMLIVLILLFGAVSSYAVRWFIGLPGAAVPIAMSAMLGTIFFKEKIGLGLTLLTFVIAGSYFRFDMGGLIAPFVGSLAAIYRLRQLRKRRDFYLTALWIFLGACIAGIPVGLMVSSNTQTLLRIIGLSLGNAAVCSIVVMVTLPILESLFHRATDIRLLELSDMNHVLLRQLALNAPGTYQHSMIVGNLAEAACERIGANALLARVGSYFHDIGKIAKPHYFTENQTFMENPHDRLTPKMSALVIASHVKEGVKLAQQERLPPAIIDFIAQHHGMTSISFFYKKMKEQNPDARIDPEDFSYPGPKPASRETAVVMLADACEGAVRSLQEPNSTRIRQVVERVIHERLVNGQLDSSNLTFRDLGNIRESFVPILVSVHHHRLKYPEGKKEEQNGA